MPSTFVLHELAGGAWMAEAPGTASVSVSNAALIDLGDRTLVVDTFMTARAAEELRSEAMRLTGRPPFLVVNSHWHSDHIGGNRAFPEAGIVGTEAIRELIARDAPTSREEFEKAAADIKAFGTKAAAEARNDAEATRAAGLLALGDALLSDEQGHRVVLPNVLIGERLDLLGERPASILCYGRGHTESDLFVHLPDDGVLIAGDLVWTGVHPKTNDGFPPDWATVLDRIADLGPMSVVPGHGPPGSAADVEVMADYMRHVADLVASAAAGSVDPEDVDVPPGSERWSDPGRFRAGLAELASG